MAAPPTVTGWRKSTKPVSPQGCTPGPWLMRAATISPSAMAWTPSPTAAGRCAPQWKSSLSPSGKKPPLPAWQRWYIAAIAAPETSMLPLNASGRRAAPVAGGAAAGAGFLAVAVVLESDMASHFTSS